MSGHSKWHTTKRHKAVIDAKRGKIFSVLAKEITLAARAGGGSPESNARLRTLMDKARAANMPSDNIKRAVQKGTGEIPGVTYEEITYEGYAPGGVGIIVEVTTDNKNRAAAEDRLMELALEAGADDIINNGDHFEVLCTVASYDSVAKALQEKALKPESSEIAYVTSIPVPVGDAAIAKQVMELIDALEALDDVKAVHGNQEIDEKLLG